MSGALEILRLMSTMKLQNIWSSVSYFFASYFPATPASESCEQKTGGESEDK